MRISTALLALTAVALPASGRSVFGGEPQSALTTDDPNKIPGESPLELCEGGHDGDILKIQKVDLIPNPPSPGETLTIKAVGEVKETIEDGAYVILQVKYGLIKLLNTKADLCEQIQNVEMSCPIEKGLITVVKDVDLPAEIPPGKYTVFADVYSVKDEPITCLTATIVFGIHRAAENLFNIEL